MHSFNYFVTVLATAFALAGQVSAAPSTPLNSAVASTSIRLAAAKSTTAKTTSPTSSASAKASQLLVRNKLGRTSVPLSSSTSTKAASTSTSSRAATTTTSTAATATATSESASSELDGFFFGANSYYLYSLERSDRIAVLNAMKSAGMSVLRIFITHVYANNKNSGNPEVQDVEPVTLGVYDDAILKKIDILMYECSQRNIKLVIALGDRYALGFWDTDRYALTYGIVDGGSGAQMVADASVFYTSNSAMAHYDKRIDHILQHKNSYMDNQPWAELESVIYAIEPQNEPMGHMDLVSTSWTCDRAGRIKENLPSGSGILISTGGGITISTSLANWAYACDNVDIISVHDYGTDAWATAAALQVGQQKAWDAGKTLLFEEWGALGAYKASTIKSFAEAMSSYSIPWLYWEITKPGKGSSDFEVWTDEDSWNVLSNGDETGAINWSKRSEIPSGQESETQQKRSSAPAIEMPEATAPRFTKQIRRHQPRHQVKTHSIVRQVVKRN